MLNLIRNNQKKVVAGIAVLSMITFVYTGRTGSGTGGRDDREFGTLTLPGPRLMTSEVVNAQAELQAVEHYTGRLDYSQGMPQRVSLVNGMLGPRGAEVAARPELFTLLRREATVDGVQPSPTRAQALLDRWLEDATQSGLTDVPSPGTDNYDLLLNGVKDLLAVSDDFTRVAAALKASRPAVDHALATVEQSIRLNLIPVPADPASPAVKPPTADQLAAQFKQYADVSPDHADPATNPFAFGYRSPVRAAVQYLRVTRAAAEAAVVAKRSAYDWEFAARKLYWADPHKYLPTTAPVTPIPKPSPEIVARALAEVRDPLVDKMQAQVQQYLSTTLARDFQTDAAAAVPTTGPAAAGSYASLAYLQVLAADATAKFGVRVDAAQTPELSAKELAALPDLGPATVDAAAAAAASSAGDAALPGYVTDRVTAYLAVPAPRPASAAVDLLRPSPPFTEPATKAVDLLRIASVRPAGPAPDLASVRAAVEADCRAAAAYTVAEAQANQLLDAARAGHLQATAIAAGRHVLSTDPLTSQSTSVQGLFPPLDDPADFLKQAFGLLADYDPVNRPQPATVIADPAQRRLFVAQLTTVTARWSPDNLYQARLGTADAIQQQQSALAAYAWFSPTAIAQRTGYQPAPSQSHSGS